MFSFLLFLCCFVPSLYKLLFKYKILFLDKGQMETQQGEVCPLNYLCLVQVSEVKPLQFRC